MGQHNRYDGHVFEYQPVYGTGAALVGLEPTRKAAADQEFDEEDVEVYSGDRNVLSPSGPVGAAQPASESPKSGRGSAAKLAEAPPVHVDNASPDVVMTEAAPKPVGPYPHARRVGELLFLSGIGPRQAGTNEIPGGPVRDSRGQRRDYDIEAQTRAAIENVRRILEAAGSTLDRVLDVTAFLIDMDRDFATYNRVYAEYLGHAGATRTTVAVEALPTPIAIELKVIAAGGPDGAAR
jgi:2-aminomuconate deaminase